MSTNPSKKRNRDIITQRLDHIKEFIRITDTPSILTEGVRYPKRNINLYHFLKSTNTHLKYISSGSGGHTFQGRMPLRSGKPFYYALKIVPYKVHKGYGDENNPNRPENAEVKALHLFSKFVYQKYTPHIVCPITAFVSPMKSVLKLRVEHSTRQTARCRRKFEKWNKFVKHATDPEKYHQNVSILVSEWANSGDLLTYLRENYTTMSIDEWRVMMFQLLHPLAVIQMEWPTFRHNDLKANNILLHRTEWPSDKTVVGYRIREFKYKVPIMDRDLRLWDFDFACIPGHLNNTKVQSRFGKRLNIVPGQNQYYDIHFFFYTLFYQPFIKGFFEDSRVPKEVIEFIERMVPERYRDKRNLVGKKKVRTSSTREHVTPIKVLHEDVFFEPIRYKCSRSNTTTLTSTTTVTSSISHT